MSDREFDGLTAIVTGGTSGIGLATATELSDRGARVGILDQSVLESDRFATAQADVRDSAAVTAAVARLADELGGIDILVNNAGIGAEGTVNDNDIDEWARCFDVNVFGAVRVTQAVMPRLKQSPAASVVFVSSLAAVTGLSSRALYSSTKGALYSLTLAMAADYSRSGIRVNAVAPGTTNTPWIARLLLSTDDPDAELAALNARQPIGRLVAAEEVARAVVYLASPLQASTTGVVLAVDGGAGPLRPAAVNSQ